METPIDSDISPSSEAFSINRYSATFLNEMGTWARLLAIVGFIFILLIIIGSLSFSALMSRLGTALPSSSASIIAVVYIGLGMVWFMPCLYLLQFSTRIKAAIRQKDETLLQSALEVLKSHFKYIGILTVIWLALAAISVVFMVIGIMASGR